MAISVKMRQFYPPRVYLMPLLKGFPLEMGIGANGQKSSIDVATRWLKKVLR